MHQRIVHLILIFSFLVLAMACSESNGNDPPGDPVSQTWLANTPWPMVGHDVRHTCRSPYVGPQTNRLKWKYDFGVLSNGAVSIDQEGNILVGTWNKGLYCFRPDGTVKWVFETSFRIHGAPAIGLDGTIYVGILSPQHLIALTPDGELKWSLDEGGGAVRTSPAIGKGGTIYIGSSNNSVYAINPDGTIKWKYITGNLVRASPAIAQDGTIIIGSLDENLYALNPDGTLKWQYNTHGDVHGSAAIADDGTIYVNDRRILYALTPEGQLIWEYDLGSSVDTSPAIAPDGTIYMIAGDMFAFNPDGSLKWRNKGVYKSAGFMVIDRNGTIYTGGSMGTSVDDYGTFGAINPDGTFKWFVYIGDTLGPASPAIDANGTVYMASRDHHLYAFQDAP